MTTGVRVWHECKDVDLAVWLTDLGRLKTLNRARSLALRLLRRAADTPAIGREDGPGETV